MSVHLTVILSEVFYCQCAVLCLCEGKVCEEQKAGGITGTVRVGDISCGSLHSAIPYLGICVFNCSSPVSLKYETLSCYLIYSFVIWDTKCPFFAKHDFQTHVFQLEVFFKRSP